MKIIKPSFVIETPIDGKQILKHIEMCGRTCYKSEDKITDESAESFVRNIIKSGHESVLEHFNISVRIICDRGISHEIVRHRLASYSQESTRYCNYSNDKFGNELTFIEPLFNDYSCFDTWYSAMKRAEKYYFKLLKLGVTPQIARSVLPNSLKTELIMTANLREWRHFFKMRCDHSAHPQMRETVYPILTEFKRLIPVVFDYI